MDFTLKIYRELLQSLLKKGYTFLTFNDFLIKQKKNTKIVVLRHDVDLLPQNSLEFAKIQYVVNLNRKNDYRIWAVNFNTSGATQRYLKVSISQRKDNVN